MIALAGLTLAGSAFAADLPPAPMPEYKSPAVVAPVYNWTGCYISAGFGFGLWNQDYVNETIPGLAPQNGRATNGGRGWMGLAGGGCDVQIPVGSIIGNVVVGAFADYDFMNVHGSVTQMAAPGFALQGDQSQTNAWAVGGRAGALVTPNLLAYTNGGFTRSHFGQANLQLNGVGGVVAFTPSHNFNGWFLGGGAEYALNFSWLPIHGLFWRSEYRYSSFNKADLPVLLAGTGAPTGQGYNVKYYEQSVLSELIWRFNWQ
jgi:outer membrane immunogenic protein